MFWWFTELNDNLQWTTPERRAALGAWVIALLFMAVIMLAMDAYLIFGLGLNDILSSALSGGVSIGAGVGISGFISSKIWPVLSKPRMPAT